LDPQPPGTFWPVQASMGIALPFTQKIVNNRGIQYAAKFSLLRLHFVLFYTLPLSGQIQYCVLESRDLSLCFSCMFLPVSTCLTLVHC